MTAENPAKIWLVPPKFWAATQKMHSEEVEQLTNRLLSLAANGEVDALRRYDFIIVGNPYRKNRLAS